MARLITFDLHVTLPCDVQYRHGQRKTWYSGKIVNIISTPSRRAYVVKLDCHQEQTYKIPFSEGHRIHLVLSDVNVSHGDNHDAEGRPRRRPRM